MIVTRGNLEIVLLGLEAHMRLGFDTETTGLRLFHGDVPFSIIFATPTEEYYFNFQSRPDIPSEAVLGRDVLDQLEARIFSNPNRTLYGHNAKFDLHALKGRGIDVLCKVFDTWTAAVILDNSHMTYGLDAVAKRYGWEKSDAVDEYIDQHKLWEWEQIPGKKKRSKNRFYYQVAFPVITDYGCKDARLAYDIGRRQESEIYTTSADPHQASLARVMEAEMRLLPHLVDMEQRGVLIDPDFCTRAAQHEQARADAAAAEFTRLTGEPFKASNKVFQKVFADQKSLWQFTDKNNPSFDSDVLGTFRNPTAEAVLTYRDAKSRADFYYGFLYYRDVNNVLHANFKNAGTATGRFSSSEPNLQNLTSEEDEEQLAQEFVVRRAFVPRPGHIFIMPDYSAMEYRMMLDVAAQMDLIDKIMEGYDVHQASADLAGITRKAAKTMNFLLLYGGGAKRLAEALGINLNEAYALRNKFFAALPKIKEFLDDITDVARRRGWIVNWFGRRSLFPDSNFAYKSANYYIQGGCADAMKIAMADIGDWLLASGYKTRMVLTIHDELVLEVPFEEVDVVPKEVQRFMESSYQHKILPMKVDMEWSAVSLADKVKGFPDGQKIRDQLSQQHRSSVSQNAS